MDGAVAEAVRMRAGGIPEVLGGEAGSCCRCVVGVFLGKVAYRRCLGRLCR